MERLEEDIPSLVLAHALVLPSVCIAMTLSMAVAVTETTGRSIDNHSDNTINS
ncbi:MAG: hypothetical protein U5K37_12795 [Natrialbaceae archaeon]|nr:hypothetical protein [Natrialbaceae archaeon]